MPKAWLGNTSPRAAISIKPGLDKVLALSAGLGWLALLFGPLLVLRPNRLAAGEGLRVWEVFNPLGPSGLAGLTGLVLLSGTLLLLSFGALPARARFIRVGKLALPVAWTGVMLFVFLAGQGARQIMDAATPFTRVSLGWGFWILLVSLGTICADRFKRVGQSAGALAVWLWLVGLAGLMAAGGLDSLAITKEFYARQSRFLGELSAHLTITGLSVAASATVGIPLGLLLHVRRLLAPRVFLVLNVAQTIPSLALFGLLMVPLSLLAERFPALGKLGVQGIGAAPAIIALTLYALLPVVRNTYAGLASIDQAAVDAGTGMGMSKWQLLRDVTIPLALPAILGGIRIALVQNIGNAAVAALIGAGGFGVFIFQGLGQAATDLVLLGALPTVLLAVAADALMQVAIPLLAPEHNRGAQA
ncbi:ABC transporter permease [Desulfocurvibacter africanus]|uniref:ABC transporter permease n=1 Tax=Desulfocurvibacter africanus TaxID=873 RepID=UPI002FD940D6